MDKILSEFEMSVKEELIDQTADECKGIFWRASESQFMSTHKSIESRKSLRLLKLKSCPGCKHCDWMWDYIKEDMSETIDILNDLVPGKLYQYRVNTYFDTEAGVYEVDCSEFYLVEES